MVGLLAEAACDAGVDIRFRSEAIQVRPGIRPRLLKADGSEMSADIVVGADGLRSRIRSELNGHHRPFFTGQVAWRAVVPNNANLPNEVHVQMGAGRHMVSYPLRDGRLVNIVAVQERADWAAEGWSHRDDPANLRQAFAGFGGRAAALLPNVTETGLWGLFRHPVAKSWHRDNVAILGDAAHPTLPFLAQGANLALEDAYTLARSLDEASEFRDGLETYGRLRRPRARRVIASANGNAWRFHLADGVLRSVLWRGLRTVNGFAPNRMLRTYDWLYRHDVTV